MDGSLPEPPGSIARGRWAAWWSLRRVNPRLGISTLLASALTLWACACQPGINPSVSTPSRVYPDPSPVRAVTITPSATAPPWLDAFQQLQTQRAATPDSASLYPTEEEERISIQPRSAAHPSLPGTLLIREASTSQQYLLLDASSLHKTILPGDHLLIPPIASVLLSPDAHYFAYTECYDDRATSLRIVDGSGNELEAPSLPPGPAWIVMAWANERTLLASDAGTIHSCACLPVFQSNPTTLAAIELPPGPSTILTDAPPFSTDEGSIDPIAFCIGVPAIFPSPSLEFLAAVRSELKAVGAPEHYLEIWDSTTSTISAQIKASILSPVGWLSSDMFAAVGDRYPYALGGDCNRRLWLVTPGGGAHAIAECIGNAISSLDRRYIAASTVMTGGRCGHDSTYEAGIVILDLSSKTSSIFLLCDLEPGTYLRLAAWSPDNRFIAFNSYGEADPPESPPKGIAILDLEAANAFYFLSDFQAVAWMTPPDEH